MLAARQHGERNSTAPGDTSERAHALERVLAMLPPGEHGLSRVLWQTVSRPAYVNGERVNARSSECAVVCGTCSHLLALSTGNGSSVRVVPDSVDAKPRRRESTPGACEALACDCCAGHDATDVPYLAAP